MRNWQVLPIVGARRWRRGVDGQRIGRDGSEELGLWRRRRQATRARQEEALEELVGRAVIKLDVADERVSKLRSGVVMQSKKQKSTSSTRTVLMRNNRPAYELRSNGGIKTCACDRVCARENQRRVETTQKSKRKQTRHEPAR